MLKFILDSSLFPVQMLTLQGTLSTSGFLGKLLLAARNWLSFNTKEQRYHQILMFTAQVDRKPYDFM